MNLARNISKQMEVTQYCLDGYTFYIYPLPAFTAAYLSGEVISLLAPLFGSIASAFKGEESLMDMDISKAAPYIGKAFSDFPSDKMENLLRNLLNSGNVGVLIEGKDDAVILTEEICNEIFCRKIQNMFLLAFHVLKVNYSDFFENIGNQSGKVNNALKKIGFPITEPSMPKDSAN